MSNDEVKSVAALAPTSVEELSSSGLMGEQKIKEYGPRLVKAVNNYIQNHNLQEYISKRPLKRPKSSDSASTTGPVSKAGKAPGSRAPIILDDDDEFGGTDIDFNELDIP